MYCIEMTKFAYENQSGEKGIEMSDVDMELLHEIMRTNVAVGE